MRLCSLLVLVCVSGAVAQTLEKETCDADRLMVDVAMNSATAVIGGLFELRQPGTDGYGCGAPDPNAILAYEAARWAVNRINTFNYIPGVKLGMKAYDTCYSQHRAIAAVNNFYPQFSSSSMYCSETGKINLGLLGTLSSLTTKPVAAMTANFPISMVSPAADSPQLSDQSKYPYFLRTAQSSSEKIKAMIMFMKEYKWSRILIVYEDSDYGKDTMHEFVRLAHDFDVCIVTAAAVPSSATVREYYDRMLEVVGGKKQYNAMGAVYIGAHDSMINVLQAVESITEAADIQWLITDAHVNSQFLSKRMRGSVLVQSSFKVVDEFFSYFTTGIDETSALLEDPWYQEWFMQKFDCKLPGVNYEPYVRFSNCTRKSSSEKMAAVNKGYLSVDATIKAVYAYAEALKNARGAGLNMQLMTPQQFNTYLKGVNFQMNEANIASLSGQQVAFDVNGDFHSSSNVFLNFHNQDNTGYGFKQVGTYSSSGISMMPLYMYNGARDTVLSSIPASLCPVSGCINCLVPKREVRFNYSPGDISIAGLFDIHEPGNEALTCGELKFMPAISAAAFKYAIVKYKLFYPDLLKGVNLGSLIVDLCDNAEKGRLLLGNLFARREIISDSNGQIVDPFEVKGAVGSLDSTEASSVAGLLGVFGLPYIDSSATSDSLSNKDMFPTFNRAVPADAHQMLAILLTMKKMGWSYIQVIYYGNTYGRNALKSIKEQGFRLSICVAAAHEMNNDNIPEIVTKLGQKMEAKAVVMIGGYSHYTKLLDAIAAQGLKGKYVFIGTESWGVDKTIVSGREDVAEGSITMQLETPNIIAFEQWLDTASQSGKGAETVPYFNELYQYVYNCYLDASQRRIYPTACTPNQRLSTAPKYRQGSYTPYTMRATYAMAKALDDVLKQYCGASYDGVCTAFRSNLKGVKEKVLAGMSNSSSLIANFQFEMENGEGKSDYLLYSYSNRDYTQIGRYDTSTKKIVFLRDPLKIPAGFSSQCTGECPECLYMLQTEPFLIQPGPRLKFATNIAGYQSDKDDPFLCSEVQITNGAQMAIATLYAVTQVNAGTAPVSLNNVQLGQLMLNHCNSPSRAYGLPSGLYSGLLEAKYQEEPNPDLDTIRAWITDTALSTEQMKDFFTDFNLPVISPMSTTNEFLDEEDYPTFLRTIPGDSNIASALTVLAKSLGRQHVIIVYSANKFGNRGKDTFTGIAQQEGLCIIASYEMGSKPINDILVDIVSSSTHVVITYLGQNDMDIFLTARGNNIDGGKLLVISPEPYPLVYNKRQGAAKNVLSLRMRSGVLEGYHKFLNGLTYEYMQQHPYLMQYYMELRQCNMPGEYKYPTNCQDNFIPITQAPNFYTDNYVLPMINSVYTFVEGAHQTLKTLCGEDYDHVCPAFYATNSSNILLEKMQQASFRDESGNLFQFIGKEGNTGREIMLYNGNKMEKVADFAGASINFLSEDFQTSYENVKSACVAPCTQCIQNNLNFTYIAGDILLGGLFDVHESTLTPYSCGKINTLRGFQLLEAFHFAINNVNDKSNGLFKNIMKNVKLGGIGLDGCQSRVRGGYLVSNIHNGLTTLKRDGEEIDPDKIEAYLGSYSSDLSIYLARLMKSLKIPQISYGASSVALNDEDKYPYFLRTVPADNKQADAMIKFMERFNIRYAQVVHTADNYGEQGAAIFKERAEKKVCVAQTVSFLPGAEVTPENANDVVLALLKKPIANTVIVFAKNTAFINALLKAVKRNPEALGKFKFIGSQSWANNGEAVEGIADQALGSVTLDLDTVDIREFDDYLSTKTPANYPENPWFPEYYEEMHDCYLTIPKAVFGNKRCGSNPRNIVASQRYKQDTAIIHVINGVYAAAIGIDMALKQVCGQNYTTVCEAFNNLDGRRDLVLSKIKQASFEDLSMQAFSFSDKGNGNKGYVLYSIDSATNPFGYVYETKAKFSSAGEMTYMKQGYAPGWDGSCLRLDACTECPTIRNMLTRYMLMQSSAVDPATIIYAGAVHDQGNDEYRCGEMNVFMFLRALAEYYTVQSLLPNRAFDLRMLILDNCNNNLRIDQDLYNIFATGKLCNADFVTDGNKIDASTVVGVATEGSRHAVAANRVTAPLSIQLVTSTASSTALSERWRYPYLARMVSPDNIQMEVIAEILKTNDWSYVAVLYTQESYGVNGFFALRDAVNKGQKSCIGFSEYISVGATVADIRPVIQRMAQTNGINVVVLIVTDPRTVLEALVAEGVADRFLVIGSDAWGSNLAVVKDIASNFYGALSISFRNTQHRDFANWIAEITYENKKGIPQEWFDEFYQHIHECHITEATITVSKYQRTCTKKETISSANILQRSVGIIDMSAAYAIGKGLREFEVAHCANNDDTFAACMATVPNSRDRLFEATLRQEWRWPQDKLTSSEEFSVKFTEDRYWNIGYTILNLQENRFVRVGDSSGDKFAFNKTAFKSYKDNLKSECPVGESCDCIIGDNTDVQPQVQEKYMRDHEPRNYFLYDEDDGAKIFNWPVWAIVVAVLTCLGLLIGICLFCFFAIFYPVKGGTTILGFLMMVGMFGIYAINFAFFLPASAATCGIREFCMGVVYAVVFAALFVKAVDNWRFKDSEYSTKRYVGLTSPISLVLIALGIVLVQCIIPLEWLIVNPPSASMMDDPTVQHDWMWCDPHDFYDISLVLSMCFVIFLVVLTAIFAALAWDSDSNYYESRWIFVASVCTGGCFLVWMVVSTNAGPPYRDPAVAIANFVNATALLICVPIRKLILLIKFKAEEEKQKTMPVMVEADHDLYSTVYTNEMYQPDVFEVPDTKPISENGY